MKTIKIKYLKILILIICIYLLGLIQLFNCLLHKYSSPDIKSIEPKNYKPNLSIYNFRNYTGEHTTPFKKKYNVSFNSFGSRNLFKIASTREDQRIVLLGDSFFFGSGLNDNETVSYFLNKIDNDNKYINLALIGANINDSVANYFSKWANMPAPKVIVFQIIWGNDICASSLIQQKAQEIIKNDCKYLLLPLRHILLRDIFLPYYLSKIYEKIHQDLTSKRFHEYIIKPLSRLAETQSKLVIIAFDSADYNKNYEKKLKDYCLSNGIYFYRLDEILEQKYLYCRISTKDRHPNAEFNKQLAFKIKALLKTKVFNDTPPLSKAIAK
ncbi:MAG: hypothetical protein KAS13_07875 [Candidatus Omnitrophica bacterium]|nr:hypothetical protein [Candidatus Omnitrophota bacterium]